MPLNVAEEIAALRANLELMAPALDALGEVYAADRARRQALLGGVPIPDARRDDARTVNDQFEAVLLGALKAAGFGHLLNTLRVPVANMAGKDFEAEAGALLDTLENAITPYV